MKKPRAKPAAKPQSRPKQAFMAATIKRQLDRVRTLCLALPEATERLSHGEPTFFARKRVFAMMSTDHHGDGHLAVVLPAEPGLQSIMIEKNPDRFYYPPYVGASGWIGVELQRVGDNELKSLIVGAWRLVAPKRAVAEWDERPGAARRRLL